MFLGFAIRLRPVVFFGSSHCFFCFGYTSLLRPSYVCVPVPLCPYKAIHPFRSMFCFDSFAYLREVFRYLIF